VILRRLTTARLDGDELIVFFEVFGWKDDGTFDAESSYELDLGACGTFKLTNFHTSCSQVIYLDEPYDLDGPGTLTITGGCGACLVEHPVPVEKSSWSTIKTLY
jgi:hypothetical protein